MIFIFSIISNKEYQSLYLFRFIDFYKYKYNFPLRSYQMKKIDFVKIEDSLEKSMDPDFVSNFEIQIECQIGIVSIIHSLYEYILIFKSVICQHGHMR